MKLFVKNMNGKEVQITPTLSTRQEIKEMAGAMFPLGGTDYYYHVHEVYAKPDADTSFMAAIIVATMCFMVTLSIKLTLLAAVPIYLIGKIYFYYDKKAVQHFNESKIE